MPAPTFTLPPYPVRVFGAGDATYAGFTGNPAVQVSDNFALFVKMAPFVPFGGTYIFVNGTIASNGWALKFNTGGLGSNQGELGAEVGGSSYLTFGGGVYLPPCQMAWVILSRESGVWHLMVNGVDYLVTHSAGSQVPATPVGNCYVGGYIGGNLYFGVLDTMAMWVGSGSPPLSSGDKAALSADESPLDIEPSLLRVCTFLRGQDPEPDSSGNSRDLTVLTYTPTGYGIPVDQAAPIQAPSGGVVISRRRRVR